MFALINVFGDAKNLTLSDDILNGNSVCRQPSKFLNPVSRSEHEEASRFYHFPREYEPETPMICDDTGGNGFVQERVPGTPELFYTSLRLFRVRTSQQANNTKRVTSSTGSDMAHFRSGLMF